MQQQYQQYVQQQPAMMAGSMNAQQIAFGAMPQQQFGGMPMQAVPQMMPQHSMQQMQIQLARMQQPMQQPMMSQQPVQQMQQPMAQAMPVVQQGMQLAPQPVQQALPGPKIRTYTPEGGEMLQITVLGTKDVPGFSNGVVHVQVPGKHDFELETVAMTNGIPQPRTVVTYIQPGDSLVFTLAGGQMDCNAQLDGTEFYPGGFSGELQLASGGALVVKISPLGTQGQIQQLAPITTEVPRQQAVAGPPVVAGMGPMRHVSPGEFEQLSQHPGAAPVQVLSPEDIRQAGFAPIGVPQPMMPMTTQCA